MYLLVKYSDTEQKIQMLSHTLIEATVLASYATTDKHFSYKRAFKD